MSLRVLVKSALNATTGYGRDGLEIIEALVEDIGVRPMVLPTSVVPPVNESTADALLRPIEPPFDVVLQHVDPSQLGLSPGERRSSHKTVAWTMWEFDRMPASDPWVATLEERLSAFDVVVAYDETTAAALQPFVTGSTRLAVVQGGADLRAFSPGPQKLPDAPFVFGCVGALNQRKAPFRLIEAFDIVHAENPNTQLVLKTLDKSLHPALEQAHPGLRIIYQWLDEDGLAALYREVDCYVGPSWGEGKNRPALEAAASGCSLLLSDCGGHRQWWDDRFGVLVPGARAVHDGMGYVDVPADKLAEAMLDMSRNPSRSRYCGEEAARAVQGRVSWGRALHTVLSL